jgi:hypothetical protein
VPSSWRLLAQETLRRQGAYGLGFAFFVLLGSAVQTKRAPETSIQEMGWAHIVKRGEHASLRSGALSLQLIEHATHRLALELGLRATKVAREGRKLRQGGERANVFFRAIHEGADDDEPATISKKTRGHGTQLACEHQVQEQRLQYVVAMMA